MNTRCRVTCDATTRPAGNDNRTCRTAPSVGPWSLERRIGRSPGVRRGDDESHERAPPQWPTAIVARSKCDSRECARCGSASTGGWRAAGPRARGAITGCATRERCRPSEQPAVARTRPNSRPSRTTPIAAALRWPRRLQQLAEIGGRRALLMHTTCRLLHRRAASGRTTGDRESCVASWFPDTAPTAAGGLLFVLPVLEQVGFAKWAAERGPEEPAPDVLAAEIMRLLLSRLGVDRMTPSGGSRQPPAQAGSHEGIEWFPAAAGRVSDLRGCPLQPEASSDLRGFRLQPEGCERATIWLTSCRRYLRRHARIGLASPGPATARVLLSHPHTSTSSSV